MLQSMPTLFFILELFIRMWILRLPVCGFYYHRDLGISNNNMLRTIVWCCVLLTGSKKGNSHIIHSVKVMKVNGSIISLNMNRNSQHLAVGSDQGYVNSLFPFFLFFCYILTWLHSLYFGSYFQDIIMNSPDIGSF